MSKAHAGTVVLPDFQRDFVWKPHDVIKLLSSLLNGYPIGGLLFMENSGAYGFRVLDGVPEARTPAGDSPDTVLVLDGQQRLTSCYRVFYGTLAKDHKHSGRYYFDFVRFVDNPNISGSELEDLLIYKTPKEVDKELADPAKEMAAGLFPLDVVFASPRGFDYSKWLSQYVFSKSKGVEAAFATLSDLQARFTRNFIERITSYQVHFESIKKDTSSDVICTVFETINSTGKRLTVFDLLVARCYPRGIRLRDMLDGAVARPAIHAFDEDGEKLVSMALPRIISLWTKGTSKRADVLELSPDDIERHWSNSVAAFERALEYLRQRYGCRGLRFVPLVDIIPPMAIIVSSPKFTASPADLEKLDKWYWRCVFGQYFVSSTETKIGRTIREWLGDRKEKGWMEDAALEPESVRDFRYQRSLLDGVGRTDNAIYRGVLSALLARELLDFGKERQRLDQAAWHIIEDHHIYPKRFLEPYGIKGERVNTIANRTPLLEATNLKITNQAPHVYLADADACGPDGVPDAVLAQHCIDPAVARQPFTAELYQSFLDKRTAALMQRIAGLVKAEPIAED
jgi:hypothetical protein